MGTRTPLPGATDPYRLAFEIAAVGMVIVSLEGVIVRANRAAGALLGYPPQELEGRPWRDFTHPDDLDVSEELFKRAMEGLDDELHLEKRYVRGDGTVVWTLVSTALARDPDGTALYFCTHLSDIGLRRERERTALAADLAKTEFLTRMSHELRTPLTAVLGFARLLQVQLEESDRRHEWADHIHRAGSHLLELINEVLDVSRIETGHLTMSLEPVGLAEAFDEAVDLLAPLAAEREVTLHVEAPEPGSGVVADRQRLRQVLINLLGNAVKYNADAGRTALEATAVDGGRMRIAVTDTGPGIARDQQGLLFTPFERLDAAVGPVNGTGLGLALSRGLVEAMGGTIGVESELGRGSTFWFELVATSVPASPMPAPPERWQAARRGGGAPARVLYFEDNLVSLRLVQEVFSLRPEVQLVPALRGEVGLELARSQQPDVVLLDLHLPDLPGREVLGRLRADPATAAIPVVVLTADPSPGQRRRLLAAGAAACLEKPVDPTVLLGHLDELLSAAHRG